MKTKLVLTVGLFALVASAGSAQLNRTAVSVTGLDTNACTPALPCRTFAAAQMQTNAGGEIIALDSGGYGPITVTKSLSVIAAPGVYAGITAPYLGTAVNVAFPVPFPSILRNDESFTETAAAAAGVSSRPRSKPLTTQSSM